MAFHLDFYRITILFNTLCSKIIIFPYNEVYINIQVFRLIFYCISSPKGGGDFYNFPRFTGCVGLLFLSGLLDVLFKRP